jgi:hypothetical protein
MFLFEEKVRVPKGKGTCPPFPPLRTERAARGDKRYQRGDEDGSFSDSDDQSQSLCKDVQQYAKAKKPRNEGDRGD